VIDLPYREIWLADFEFRQPDGERPEPACLVAMELRSGRKIRLWRDQFGPLPPYPLDPHSLFVAFYASAEMCCHRVLGWPMPARVLDLFTEFRDLTNGKRGLDGGFQKASLLEAMSYFGLAHIAPVEKATMRDKFISGKDFDLWTPEEREEGLDYCETDRSSPGRSLARHAARHRPTQGFNSGRVLRPGNLPDAAQRRTGRCGIPAIRARQLGRHYRRIDRTDR
jgi:DNA polymerase I